MSIRKLLATDDALKQNVFTLCRSRLLSWPDAVRAQSIAEAATPL
jgi:hypothetical protein